MKLSYQYRDAGHFKNGNACPSVSNSGTQDGQNVTGS